MVVSRVTRLRSVRIDSKRNASFFKKLLFLDDSDSKDANTKFYKWDESPYDDIRTRAAFIRTKALCPVTKKPVNFVCPYSGIPTHHSKEAWEQDDEYHSKKKYELLKKVNLYEHDLRSGRQFDEFVFPGEQEHEFAINMSTWDTFFYTRDFNPMNTEFNLAAASKVLTYPITMASVMTHFSPYKLQPHGPITLEGLRSLSALRYTLFPPYKQTRDTSAVLFKERPLRIFILGAKMEAMLPGYVWKQFGYLFPDSKFEIHFIGPECYFNPDTRSFTPTSEPHGRPHVKRYDEQLTLHYHTKYFHEVYDMGDLFPFDPYLDIFFIFHPGFQTANKIHWDQSLKGLLESKCAVFVTGYHEEDTRRELLYLQNHPLADEIDILMNQSKNIFGSTKLDLVDSNPTETFQANNEMFAFRGKRYHAIKK